ncbi:Glycosyl hydrolases family 28 [bacterium A37T11]|nr:Glycosyl hydrolases family 28 [bacterium A37T11]
MKRFFTTFGLLLGFCSPFLAISKDYQASLFGIKSNGSTLNTKAIQKAIDYIHDQGGGRLVFYVGRYLTGSIQLKSNVTLKLHEGAVLVGATSVYDYMANGQPQALIHAEGQENIGISGLGVIEGNGRYLLDAIHDQQEKGFLTKESPTIPGLLDFRQCKGIQVDSVNFWGAAGKVQVYSACKQVRITRIAVISKISTGNTGLIFSNCSAVSLTDSYVETSGKPFLDEGNNVDMEVKHTSDAKGIPIF